MKNNYIEISCSTVVKNILCEALRHYAFIELAKLNYPSNAEIKSLLLNKIKMIEDEFVLKGRKFIIESDLYEHFQTAINMHYDRIQFELNARVDEQRKLLLKTINGQQTQDAELDFAMHKDNIF